MAIVSVYH